MWRSVIGTVVAAAFVGNLAAAPPRKTGATRLRVTVLAPADAAFGLHDLQADVAGTPAKVVALATPAEDLILMLVLDLAGDLTEAESARAALLREVEALPPRIRVAVLRAQDGLRVIQDPTADRTAIISAVESMNISGRAGLLDSVETAAAVGDSILTKSAVRAAILYVTDSDVTNYREDFTNPIINSSDAGDLSRRFPEALIQEKVSKIDANLARSQVPVFLVHVNSRSDRLNEAYLNGLRQLAFTTGGMSIFCRSNGEIPGAIRDVLAAIGNHYSVTLELPKVRSQAAEVRLKIAADGKHYDFPYRARFAIKKD